MGAGVVWRCLHSYVWQATLAVSVRAYLWPLHGARALLHRRVPRGPLTLTRWLRAPKVSHRCKDLESLNDTGQVAESMFGFTDARTERDCGA